MMDVGVNFAQVVEVTATSMSTELGVINKNAELPVRHPLNLRELLLLVEKRVHRELA